MQRDHFYSEKVNLGRTVQKMDMQLNLTRAMLCYSLAFTLMPHQIQQACMEAARSLLVKSGLRQSGFVFGPSINTCHVHSRSGGCTDENLMCPQWAVAGECQKNPHYMVGSKGSPGFCRKSCRVCVS